MNQDTWAVVEDYIFALLTAAIAPGGPLGVQPNPDGTTGIKDLSRIAPPETATFPNIGFMCTDFEEDVTGAKRHELVTHFTIVVSVRMAHDPSITKVGEAALQYLRLYQNDNAGNGISPLLRTNVTLGGMVRDSKIKSMTRFVAAGESDSSDIIASAVYLFDTNSDLKLTF
ncbi:MAG TPA: hypothetical protein VHR97_01735 [Candidatus Baltobacteraceae bacterium]|nr:hypothetical protein [Candidatus Baltobacteraceae bacterium]